MTIRYIDSMDLTEKRILIRVDYNVPYNDSMEITDDTRIRATIPTLKYCLEKNARIILISHLGRPKGKPVPGLSLKPVAEHLSSLLQKEIKFIDIPIGPDVQKITDALQNGEIALLENIRFNPGEKKNDEELGKALASLADVYINDAFATAHRAHASNDAVTRYIAERAAGFLMENEIEYFKKVMENPKRPLGAIIGGAKVSSKLAALEHILSKVNFILIGGGMAFTFLKAQGHNIGKSLLEEELIGTAGDILKEAESKNVAILLPPDIVTAPEFKNDSPRSIVQADKIKNDMIGLDIGPESISLFKEKIAGAKTVIWNGPMGAFEMPNFADGTNAIAEALAAADCLSIVGGGDSVTAINKAGVADKMSYISTGGGAFLELLEGKKLPAFAALES